jgi:hypothetical protein
MLLRTSLGILEKIEKNGFLYLVEDLVNPERQRYYHFLDAPIVAIV